MQKLRIFLVDDEAMALRHFRRLMDENSELYEFSGSAENGEKALQQLEHMMVDLVFADVQMPVMNGLELAEKIRKQYPAVRVVLLTAFKEFSYAQRGMNAGVYAYLVKHEISRQQVEDIIQHVYNDIQVENEEKRAYLEKNLKAFLMSGDCLQRMDLSYHKYRFVLLDVVVRQPLCLEGTYLNHTEFPVQLLEKQLQTEDLFCRSAVKMSAVSYVAILYVKKGIFEKAYYYQLNAILNTLQFLFTERGLDTVVISSQVLEQFADLPVAYQQQKACEPYIYAETRQRVFFSEEMKKIRRDYSQVIHAREELFSDETTDKMPEHLGQLFQAGRSACTIEQYLGELNHLAAQLILLGQALHLSAAAEWEEQRRQPFQDLDLLEDWILKVYQSCLCEKKQQEQAEYSTIVWKAIELMKREYASPLTGEDICEHLNISESHFRRKFKNEVGIKPIEYLNRYRIEVAKQLLKSGDYRVQDICEMVGFSSSQYFSTVFKKLTGISPRQYYEKKGHENEKIDKL